MNLDSQNTRKMSSLTSNWLHINGFNSKIRDYNIIVVLSMFYGSLTMAGTTCSICQDTFKADEDRGSIKEIAMKTFVEASKRRKNGHHTI